MKKLDEENVAHLHNELLLNSYKNEITKLTDKLATDQDNGLNGKNRDGQLKLRYIWEIAWKPNIVEVS